MLEMYAPGTVWLSDRFGEYEVVSIRAADDVTIKWKRDGYIQTPVRTVSIRTGDIVCDAQQPDGTPIEYYVYAVTHLGTGAIVYIGRGFGNRFRHAYSGISSSRELNRMYFNKEPLLVEVWRQGMTKQDADSLEKQMIRHHKPVCNFVTYSSISYQRTESLKNAILAA